MDVYLAADSERLRQAMACTTQLAHMSYRMGPEGTLLSSPLPAGLRGGLLMLSDEGGRYPTQAEGLCRALAQECQRRHYAGVVLDAAPPEGFCRALDEALTRQGRKLFLPESVAPFAPHGIALLCTALTSGDLEQHLSDAAGRWGPERLALDLQRMMIDYPLSGPGSGVPLTIGQLHQLAQGRATYFSRPLCARYFTYRSDGGGTRFVLFDDLQTLQAKMEVAERLGIRQGFFMLPEVEDLTGGLFPQRESAAR